jgi:hypothetical protein
VPWKVTLQRSGSLIASGTKTTLAPSGSFTFRKLARVTGTVTAVATRSGERCSATASI